MDTRFLRLEQPFELVEDTGYLFFFFFNGSFFVLQIQQQPVRIHRLEMPFPAQDAVGDHSLLQQLVQGIVYRPPMDMGLARDTACQQRAFSEEREVYPDLIAVQADPGEGVLHKGMGCHHLFKCSVLRWDNPPQISLFGTASPLPKIDGKLFGGNMRITLAEIPVYRTPGIFTRNSCFDPLGIEYVAGTLLREGAEVMVMQQRGQGLDQFAGEILATEPDMVGFSAMTYNFPASTYVARLIKGRKPGVVTLFGGEHVSAVPDEVRDGCIDFVVMGEGEETASELVMALSSGSDASGIAGLAYKQGGDIVINPRRARNKTLDSLPFPLRSPALLEGNAITHMSPPISAQRAVTQMTYSRGCPYSCSYCTAPSMWLPTVSWREPKHVIGEIKETQKRFGTNTVFFTDLTFNANPARAEKLCDAMLDEGIRLYWYAMARTDR